MKESHKRCVLGLCIDYSFWKRVIYVRQVWQILYTEMSITQNSIVFDAQVEKGAI